MPNTSCSSTLSPTKEKECFEDSSSGDAEDIAQPLRVRLKWNRGMMTTSTTSVASLKNAEAMVELRVTVKIGSSKLLLGASTMRAHVCVAASANISRGKPPKKKGKRKTNNWRERPVRARARAHAPFERTLPGELPHAIIVATRVSSAGTVVDTPNIERDDDCSDEHCGTCMAGEESHEQEGKASTRKQVRAARKKIRDTKGLVVGLLREHPSLSLASHSQVANVIAKCLPLQSVSPFLFMFNSFRPSPLQKQKKGKGKNRVMTSVPAAQNLARLSSPGNKERIGKTPIEWIDSALKHAFGDEYVMLKRCIHPIEMYSHGETHSDMDVVVMDCVLSRSNHINNVKNKSVSVAHHASNAPEQACSFRDVDAVTLAIAARDGNAFNGGLPSEKDSDDFYRACLVVLPQAGVFYCHRERRSEVTGVINSHVPMDINWLRLRHADSSGGCFGKGAYVSRLTNVDGCSIWKWSIRRSSTNLLPFYNAIMGVTPRSCMKFIHCTTQLTDEVGPALPPDHIVGEADEMSKADLKCRTETFQDAFSRSRSARRGGRHYAPGFLHKGQAIDPSTTFVIDPREYGELDLQVDVTIPSNTAGGVCFHRCSVVQIRYLPSVVGSGCDELLADINMHCDMVRRQKGNAGARTGNGDLGAMHPIGSRISKCWHHVQYVTSAVGEAVPVLLRAVQAVAKLASVCIPAALRAIQDLENDSGMHHVLGMDGGVCRVAHSMDLSINLANSSHYDSNDASQGLTIWTEEHPGTTQDWYFVLPNMRGKFPGTNREYNGIAIKLTHGVLIGWDGRLIRHGTSMVRSRIGNIYGTFFAAKTRIIMYGMSQLQKD